MLPFGIYRIQHSDRRPDKFSSPTDLFILSCRPARPPAQLDCFALQLAVLFAPLSHAPVAQLDRASDLESCRSAIGATSRAHHECFSFGEL